MRSVLTLFLRKIYYKRKNHHLNRTLNSFPDWKKLDECNEKIILTSTSNVKVAKSYDTEMIW